MKDFFELLANVLGPRRPKLTGVPIGRKPIPITLPIGLPLTPKEQRDVNKKSRIVELETEVKGLKEQFTEQTELLERLVRELSALRREVAHLLPEK